MPVENSRQNNEWRYLKKMKRLTRRGSLSLTTVTFFKVSVSKGDKKSKSRIQVRLFLCFLSLFMFLYVFNQIEAVVFSSKAKITRIQKKS